MAHAARLAVLGAALAVLLTACQGNYNPRLHVDDTPPPPGHFKKHWYNPY